jgi:hypothetical protein
MDSSKEKKGAIDRFVDFLFSNDSRKWLIFILLLGILLRFLVANNVSPIADEMVHAPHSIGILESGVIGRIWQSITWSYLTDVSYNLFGVTLFSMRFLSFFYGSLSILLIYLIGAKMFGRRIGLIAAFLLAVSYFVVRYTLAEMDASAIFFLLIATYDILISHPKKKFPYIAAISLGVASLIKTLSLFFLPAFFILFFLLDKNRSDKKRFVKRNIKTIILFSIIIGLFYSVVLIHNFLWFKDKGMVDAYISQYFDIGNTRQAYQGIAGQNSGITYSIFFSNLSLMSKILYTSDELLVLLGLAGLILLFFIKDKKDYLMFILAYQIFGFSLLALSNTLPTHITTMMPFLCLTGAILIEKISLRIRIKHFTIILLLIILIFQLNMLRPHLTSQGAVGNLREYAIKEMDKNSLVVADGRIYRGRVAWMFNDFHYLEANYFTNLLEVNKNLSANYPVKTYFIECAADDCGWGTINSQSEFNKSMEDLFDQISSQVNAKKVIFGGGGYDGEINQPYFKVYETTLNLNPNLLYAVDSTHEWFYYPMRYRPKEKIFDIYSLNNGFDKLLFNIAKIIIFISMALAVLMPLMLIRYLSKENENINNNSSI